jgi:SAM-dependent methyltransferase
MKRGEIDRLYDDEYAASYEDKFLLSALSIADSQHELGLLRGFLKPGITWLDVACGTGYFLRHFPEIERAGIDLSPAMLRRAQAVNPGVEFKLHDFREPIPAWTDRWGLVSCMWYAYGLIDTVPDILRLIGNLAAWTKPEGTCFVPLADPRMITGVNLPYQVPSPFPGKVMITGILWSYIEDDGHKVHAYQIAPNLEFMVEQFGRFFENVTVERYPPAFPGEQGRPALIARRKRATIVEHAMQFSTASPAPVKP